MNDTILKKINDFNLNELKKSRSKEYILNLKRCSEDIKKAKNKNLKSIVENYDINLHDLIMIYTEKQPEAIKNTCVKLSKLVALNVKNYQTDLLYDINFIIKNPDEDYIFITYEHGTRLIKLESTYLKNITDKNLIKDFENLIDSLDYDYLNRNIAPNMKPFYVIPGKNYIKSINKDDFITFKNNAEKVLLMLKNGEIN